MHTSEKNPLKHQMNNVTRINEWLFHKYFLLLSLFNCWYKEGHVLTSSKCPRLVPKAIAGILLPSFSLYVNGLVQSTCWQRLLSLFPTMLGSASSLTGCSWIPVFYMERLPIWPPQPSYWATRYLLVRLDVRLSGFWLSVTTVKDLRMTAGTNGFTCFPRHGGVTPPPTSKLRATTEKFLMEKPNNTFCPTWAKIS